MGPYSQAVERDSETKTGPGQWKPCYSGDVAAQFVEKALPVNLCSRSIYGLTYGHKLWVVTERIRLRVQVVGFLCSSAGLSCKRVKRLAIQESLGVEQS